MKQGSEQKQEGCVHYWHLSTVAIKGMYLGRCLKCKEARMFKAPYAVPYSDQRKIKAKEDRARRLSLVQSQESSSRVITKGLVSPGSGEVASQW